MAAMPKEPALAQEAIRLSNGSFETWSGGTPANWNIYGDGKIRQSVQAIHGHFGVRMELAEGGKSLSLQYIFRPVEDLKGKTLLITIWAKCDEPRSLGFNVHLERGGDTTSFSRSHPGNGEWMQLRHEVELPAGVDPSLLQVRCVALIRRGAELPASVDAFDD